MLESTGLYNYSYFILAQLPYFAVLLLRLSSGNDLSKKSTNP